MLLVPLHSVMDHLLKRKRNTLEEFNEEEHGIVDNINNTKEKAQEQLHALRITLEDAFDTANRTSPQLIAQENMISVLNAQVLVLQADVEAAKVDSKRWHSELDTSKATIAELKLEEALLKEEIVRLNTVAKRVKREKDERISQLENEIATLYSANSQYRATLAASNAVGMDSDELNIKMKRLQAENVRLQASLASALSSDEKLKQTYRCTYELYNEVMDDNAKMNEQMSDLRKQVDDLEEERIAKDRQMKRLELALAAATTATTSSTSASTSSALSSVNVATSSGALATSGVLATAGVFPVSSVTSLPAALAADDHLSVSMKAVDVQLQHRLPSVPAPVIPRAPLLSSSSVLRPMESDTLHLAAPTVVGDSVQQDSFERLTCDTAGSSDLGSDGSEGNDDDNDDGREVGDGDSHDSDGNRDSEGINDEGSEMYASERDSSGRSADISQTSPELAIDTMQKVETASSSNNVSNSSKNSSVVSIAAAELNQTFLAPPAPATTFTAGGGAEASAATMRSEGNLLAERAPSQASASTFSDENATNVVFIPSSCYSKNEKGFSVLTSLPPPQTSRPKQFPPTSRPKQFPPLSTAPAPPRASYKPSAASVVAQEASPPPSPSALTRLQQLHAEHHKAVRPVSLSSASASDEIVLQDPALAPRNSYANSFSTENQQQRLQQQQQREDYFYKVLISNVPLSTPAFEVQDLARTCGYVSDFQQQARGTSYVVEYTVASNAKRAVAEINNYWLDGVPIRCRKYEEPTTWENVATYSHTPLSSSNTRPSLHAESNAFPSSRSASAYNGGVILQDPALEVMKSPTKRTFTVTTTNCGEAGAVSKAVHKALSRACTHCRDAGRYGAQYSHITEACRFYRGTRPTTITASATSVPHKIVRADPVLQGNTRGYRDADRGGFNNNVHTSSSGACPTGSYKGYNSRDSSGGGYGGSAGPVVGVKRSLDSASGSGSGSSGSGEPVVTLRDSLVKPLSTHR